MDQSFPTPGRLQLEMRIPAGSIRLKAEETTTTQLSIRGNGTPTTSGSRSTMHPPTNSV